MQHKNLRQVGLRSLGGLGPQFNPNSSLDHGCGFHLQTPNKVSAHSSEVQHSSQLKQASMRSIDTETPRHRDRLLCVEDAKPR